MVLEVMKSFLKQMISTAMYLNPSRVDLRTLMIKKDSGKEQLWQEHHVA